MILEVEEVWGCIEHHSCLDSFQHAVMGLYNMSEAEFTAWEFETRTGVPSDMAQGLYVRVYEMEMDRKCSVYDMCTRWRWTGDAPEEEEAAVAFRLSYFSLSVPLKPSRT